MIIIAMVYFLRGKRTLKRKGRVSAKTEEARRKKGDGGEKIKR